MHIQILILVLITGLLSGLGGFVIGMNKNAESQLHTPASQLHTPEHLVPHTHGTREIGAGELVPTIELMAHRDPKSGYNLEIITTNFTFSPENVSTEHSAGEGHAHLFINQNKIGRLYGNWHHIPFLPKGQNKIRVDLSGNDHTELTVNGTPIAAEIIINVE